MSENNVNIGVAANGKVKLHIKSEFVAVGVELDPEQAKKIGSTLQSEAYHANNP